MGQSHSDMVTIKSLVNSHRYIHIFRKTINGGYKALYFYMQGLRKSSFFHQNTSSDSSCWHIPMVHRVCMGTERFFSEGGGGDQFWACLSQTNAYERWVKPKMGTRPPNLTSLSKKMLMGPPLLCTSQHRRVSHEARGEERWQEWQEKKPITFWAPTPVLVGEHIYHTSTLGYVRMCKREPDLENAHEQAPQKTKILSPVPSSSLFPARPQVRFKCTCTLNPKCVSVLGLGGRRGEGDSKWAFVLLRAHIGRGALKVMGNQMTSLWFLSDEAAKKKKEDKNQHFCLAWSNIFWFSIFWKVFFWAEKETKLFSGPFLFSTLTGWVKMQLLLSFLPQLNLSVFTQYIEVITCFTGKNMRNGKKKTGLWGEWNTWVNLHTHTHTHTHKLYSHTFKNYTHTKELHWSSFRNPIGDICFNPPPASASTSCSARQKWNLWLCR